jgi:hypothetical protein
LSERHPSEPLPWHHDVDEHLKHAAELNKLSKVGDSPRSATKANAEATIASTLVQMKQVEVLERIAGQLDFLFEIKQTIRESFDNLGEIMYRSKGGSS